MSGRRLAAILAAVVVLALMLPPLAAQQLHARRIARASAAVERLATALQRAGGAGLAQHAGIAGRAPVVLAGAGAAPVLSAESGWPADRAVSLAVVLRRLALAPQADGEARSFDEPDPWGNQYLVVIDGDGLRASVMALSAGPNGIVDTPFGLAASPRGDDIVVRR
ncbi:MAG: hypothetical protein WCP29_13070 [Acidobacteriota bacterium]